MSERTLHKAVCDYLRLNHPYALFNSDLSGATKLTLGQAVALKSLRSGRGFPDLVIYEPSCTGKYSALFLELKQEGTKLYNKQVSRHATYSRTVRNNRTVEPKGLLC
jgi:hypothetical protein